MSEYHDDPGKPERSADQVADLLLMGRNYSDNTDDSETNATDLLADIMHWCDVYAVDFAAALESAQNHYLAERESGLVHYWGEI